ncbi:MAG: hypothetical protein DI629_16485 [Mesorhizobium amorphae]|nr:MAG: hypothetical protein DI629_16485 [Mesorhizobium amorphae]
MNFHAGTNRFREGKLLRIDVSRSARDSLLISIKTKFADKILSGEKTIEVRKQFPPMNSFDGRMLVYSSGSAKSLVALVEVESVTRLPVASFWNAYGAQTALSAQEIDLYFGSATEGCAVRIKSVLPLARTVSYSELKDVWGIAPPQSYRYISPTDLSSLVQVAS